MEELYSIYYNPKSGLLYTLYLKLKKKDPLRKIEEFVKKQEVWQMKQPRIKPQFNHIHVYSRNHLWQIDLVDFSKFSHWNRGYKYLLCAIDVYSRKSFVVPLKRKSDAHLGMGIILMKTKPVLIQSDNGTEFISKEFQHVLDKHDVRHVTVIAGDHNRQRPDERVVCAQTVTWKTPQGRGGGVAGEGGSARGQERLPGVREGTDWQRRGQRRGRLAGEGDRGQGGQAAGQQ